MQSGVHPDSVTYVHVLKAMLEMGLMTKFWNFSNEGLYADAMNYVYALKAYGIVARLDIGGGIVAHLDVGGGIVAKVRKQGLLQNDIMLGNAVLDMYCKCGSVEKAQKAFTQLPE